MITTACNYCGLKILVPESIQGREGKCLNCGNPITVPMQENGLTQPSISFNPGDIINDRYVIQAYIGKGGMGVVYHAEDNLVKEEVALKFLRPDILRTSKGRHMFLQEAQIARRLRHENIIAVHDVGFTGDGVLFLSMEFAQGQSLRKLLMDHREKRKHISVRLTCTIALQVLNALHYAHRLVVHRDMKPENIQLLTNERIKVLDFGLAKAVEEEDLFESSKSRSKNIIGTFAYASPEQALHNPVDLRSDIYSVGLVLRELLTLRTPLEWPPDKPINREDAPAEYLSVIDRAVQRDKNERWQSAESFASALKSAFEEAYSFAQNTHIPQEFACSANTEGMVFQEGGTFLMGNNSIKEESPEAEVTVMPFWMDIYPVTVSQYGIYLRETGAQEPLYWRNPQFNGPEQPVVGISWNEACAYAAWAGKQLPSETQWEFAARGRENRRFPWGNIPPEPSKCNYRNYLGMPSTVSMHDEGKTPDGIFDMAGNVYEWTLDPYASYEQIRNGTGLSSEIPRRTVRGGCYESDGFDVTTTARKGLFPNVRLKTVGFRCVVPANLGK